MNPGCWRQPSFLPLSFFEESNVDFNHRTQLYLNYILTWSYKAISIWKYIDLPWRRRELSAKTHCGFITENLSESCRADGASPVYWWVFSQKGVLERFARAQLLCEQGRHRLCSLKWPSSRSLGCSSALSPPQRAGAELPWVHVRNACLGVGFLHTVSWLLYV